MSFDCQFVLSGRRVFLKQQQPQDGVLREMLSRPRGGRRTGRSTRFDSVRESLVFAERPVHWLGGLETF
jgi:hypothetical protein